METAIKPAYLAVAAAGRLLLFRRGHGVETNLSAAAYRTYALLPIRTVKEADATTQSAVGLYGGKMMSCCV